MFDNIDSESSTANDSNVIDVTFKTSTLIAIYTYIGTREPGNPSLDHTHPCNLGLT